MWKLTFLAWPWPQIDLLTSRFSKNASVSNLDGFLVQKQPINMCRTILKRYLNMVTFGDLWWPDLDLTPHDTSFGVSSYLFWSIPSTFRDYRAHCSLRSALCPRRLKSPIFTFDLNLTWPLTLTSNFFACCEVGLTRAFHRRFIFENRTVSFGVRQGGRKTPQWVI